MPGTPPMMVSQVTVPYGYPTPDDRTMGMLCHLLGLLTNFLGPLILWLVKKDASRFVDHHGREALNLHLTRLIVIFPAVIICFVTLPFGIGFLFLPLLVLYGIFCLVVEILAAIAANRGEWYRYPLVIRIL
ncbi:MAG: DUF4870 domain-containing protein [Luteolibacter sp.]